MQRPPGGCFPRAVLEKAAGALRVPATGSDATLRARVEEALGVPENQEYSFLQRLPFPMAEKQTLLKKYLRPPAPEAWKGDPDMWLDSINIADVMKQYEEAYPEFEFMGPYPIDFAAPNPYSKDKKTCLINEMCEMRVSKARAAGKRCIGIIYNLDPHFKSGSHWVATFLDLKQSKCFYFDSYGMEPPAQIATFMKWISTQEPRMQLAYNARRLQFKNTECGVYCLYFIIRMLHGDEFVVFSRSKPGDADMLDLRDWLFCT